MSTHMGSSYCISKHLASHMLSYQVFFSGMKMDANNVLDFRPNNHQNWTLYIYGSPLGISYPGLHCEEVIVTKGPKAQAYF